MKKTNFLICILCVAVIALFIAIIAIPATNAVFTALTSEHPFIMGFIKFAFLATVGEIIALRLKTKAWSFPSMVWLRFIIWGVLGAWITFMMTSFKYAISGLIDNNVIWCIADAQSFGARLIKAFCISAIMNTTFGPTFMALHKITDKWIDLSVAKEPRSLLDTVRAVDWAQFVSFTILKCVPFFWIPAHTLTFMLPSQYQVMVAAFLSIALGILLSFKKSK